MKFLLALMAVLFSIGCSHSMAKPESLICTGMTIKTWGATWCPGCQQQMKQIEELQAETKKNDPAEFCYKSEIRTFFDGRTIVAKFEHIDTSDMTPEQRMATGQLTHTIPEAQVWSSGNPVPVRVNCKAYAPTSEEVQDLFAAAYRIVSQGKTPATNTKDCPR